MNFNNKKIFRFLVLFVTINLALFQVGCKKFIDVSPPPDQIIGENAFNDDATAIAVLTNLYIDEGSSTSTPRRTTLSRYMGLYADELILWQDVTNVSQTRHYINDLISNLTVSAGQEYWNFNSILICNTVIQELGKPVKLSAAVKQQLLGEAKFMRAFSNFYLLQLYGDIPIITSTDYEVNRLISRSPENAVYQFIVNDLKEAKEQLSEKFLDGNLNEYPGTSTAERVRPTKWAASALLARVYLYTGEYSLAESEASALISNAGTFSLPSLNAVFLKNSNETIWQIQPVNANKNTEDGAVFVLPAAGPSTSNNPYYLSSFLLNAFEPNDQRKTINNWIGSVTLTIAGQPVTYYYPYKYKLGRNTTPGSEYMMVFRLGEQYLIRSEARARLGNLGGAISDLDKIRSRAGLPLIANTNPTIIQSDLIAKILHERQVELFTEWGHRWFDLKRSGQADATMSVVTPVKGGTWASYKKLFPVPFGDLEKNPNLVQNTGY